MDHKEKVNELILKSAYVIILVLIIAVIALLILKYEVEGEKNMPFKLSSILVMSKAEGYQETESTEYKWNTNIYQCNDIYLNIEKNKNYKETELIKSISIENIQVEEEPTVGSIHFYRISNDEVSSFSYNDEYIINNNVQYVGDIKSNLKELKISNQGETIIIRVVNKTGINYTSNEEEFEHDGKLLKKAQISYEEVKSTISFDLVINLESDISFRAKVQLQLPAGNIVEEGSSCTEIKDMKNIVFKREQL